MKKLLIISLLLYSMLALSQIDDISKIDFKLNIDGSIETDTSKLSNIKLPVKFIFSPDFKGKHIKFTTFDGQIFAPKVKLFGDQNLQKDGEDGTYRIEIEKDSTINPGDNDKINTEKFILQIDQTKFKIFLVGNTADNNQGTRKTAQVKEKYVAGYIYYDVVKLVELLNNKSDDRTIIEILKAYHVDLLNIKSNPYLDEVFADFLSLRPEGGAASAFITGLGNTDVTNFAAGLARFLAERAKEELNEAFFSKMKEQLNAYPELKTLFPKTTSFLDLIETYSYASVVQVLKVSFETDIQNLPENLYNIKTLTNADCNKIAICGDCIKNTSKYTDCETRLDNLNKFFESQEGRWIGLGMYTVKEAMKSTNPADLLKSITESEDLAGIKKFSQDSAKYANYNLASSIELGNFLSQSLISKDEDQIWINLRELSELFRDDITFKTYLGLLLAKGKMSDVKISFYNSADTLVTFDSILIIASQKFKEDKLEILSLIKNTHAAFNSANNAVKKMIAATAKSVESDPQALYDYYRTFAASFKPITHNEFIKAMTGKDLGVEYDKVERILDPAVDIAYHIASKEYSAAIYDVVLFLNSSNKPVFEKPIAKSFIKYGTLISTVANAQSSDEVKKALEASFLPVGSYSIKRKTTFSSSVNSYVGAYWNYANKKDYIPTLGLSAPIGFNFSWGICKTGNAGGFSVNLQVIDLGALVNYYLINGDTAALPNEFKVRLSNIFAPGINMGYNVPKTPLTLTWGVHYIPALYKVEQINGKNEFTPVDTWRCQFSILIDIPLMNLKVWDFYK